MRNRVFEPDPRLNALVKSVLSDSPAPTYAENVVPPVTAEPGESAAETGDAGCVTTLSVANVSTPATNANAVPTRPNRRFGDSPPACTMLLPFSWRARGRSASPEHHSGPRTRGALNSAQDAPLVSTTPVAPRPLRQG